MKMTCKNKNKIRIGLFILIGLFGLICSIVAQEARQSNVVTTVPPAEQDSTKSNRTTSSVVSETTKVPNDLSSTNVSNSNIETNTNVVPSAENSTNVIPESTPADNSTNVPLPMDPNEGNATEIPLEETSPVNSTESVEKKKHEIKVRYNEVRTQVEKEEAIVALRQAADKATTTEGQRQTLKAYYELLFKRMKQIDPSLTERCDLMQGAYLRRVEQKSSEPTIPLHLLSGAETNSVNASQTPAPAPKEKIHKKRSTSNTAQ